jgi:hypothetical protein
MVAPFDGTDGHCAHIAMDVRMDLLFRRRTDSRSMAFTHHCWSLANFVVDLVSTSIFIDQ